MFISLSLSNGKSGDNDPSFDRFTVEDITTITGYNGFKQFYAKIDHDILLDRDKIYRWGSGDRNGESGTLSFSAPWGLQLSLNIGSGSYDINDIGFAPLDYARWELDPDRSTSLPNPTKFESSTAWYSAQSATYATMDIRYWAYLDNVWETEKSVYGMFNVDYNY